MHTLSPVLLAMIEELRAKGVEVESVDNPALNTDTPQGEFMLTILAAVAQLERSVARERQAEGIAIAKRNGIYARPPALTEEQLAPARQRVGQGVPKAAVARELGGSRAKPSTRRWAARGSTAPWTAEPEAGPTIKKER